jgi:hypothetical protein
MSIQRVKDNLLGMIQALQQMIDEESACETVDKIHCKNLEIRIEAFREVLELIEKHQGDKR